MRWVPPSYERTNRDIGVIHFGLGAFHRGHQAVYFDEALRKGVGEWGVYGISPRSAKVTDALRAQDFCYTVNARQGDKQNPEIIGSIFGGSLYSQDNFDLTKAIASPELKLITITVTEKSYVTSSDLDSMPNRLLDMLQSRFTQGLSAPTIISCDNLPSNGEYLRNVLLSSAQMRSMDLNFLEWLERLQFPNAMVDRIVPAITQEAITQFESEFGYRDESLISTEPFKQWVVAPHSGAEQLAATGIEISGEVENFETLKLRLFNGAHSTTAYFSQLSGLEYVYQAIALPEWNSFISRLQEELARSFNAPSSIDVMEYCQKARTRIGNSAVAHRSAQIAMDGSAKLPQRLFRAMNTLSEQNLKREHVAFAIALWLRFLQSGLPVTDPLSNALLESVQAVNSHQAVQRVMQTPGLQSPIFESEWKLIGDFLAKLQNHSPLDIAKNF